MQEELNMFNGSDNQPFKSDYILNIYNHKNIFNIYNCS